MLHFKQDGIWMDIAGPHEEKQVVRKILSFFDPSSTYSWEYKTGRWDGMIHLYDDDKDRFLSGMTRLVIQKLEEYEIPVEVEYSDKLPNLPVEVKADVLPGVTLRDYQISAATKSVKAQGGIIQVPTAGGKTVISASILKTLNLPSLFLVNSIRLLRQTAQRFAEYGLKNVGMVGEGVFEPGFTTVAMVQTLNSKLKRKDESALALMDSVDVLFADEMHHLSASSWERVALSARAYLRYGLSGTPFKTRSLTRYEDWVVFGICGEICYSIPTSYLVERGFIARPRLYMLPVPGAPVNYFKDWHGVYKLGIAESDARNGLALDAIQRLTAQGLKTLVLVQRIEHGKAFLQNLMAKGISGVFLTGADKIYRQGYSGVVEDVDEVVDFSSKTVEDFRAGKYQVLLASPVLDEGIDLPEVEALVILAGGKSLIKVVQRLGRALRPKPGMNEVFVVDFEDLHHPWLKGHSKKRIGEYLSEGHTVLGKHEFNFRFPKEDPND